MRAAILGLVGIFLQLSYAVKYFRNPLTSLRLGTVSSSLPARVPESLRRSAVTVSTTNNSQAGNVDVELNSILTNALDLVKMQSSGSGIQTQGWNAVHESPSFSLYKRLKNKSDVDEEGPMEYLMMGEFNDVSPSVLLKMQVEKESRKSWDSSMKDMQGDMISVGTNKDSNPLEKCTEDVMYCRSGWPWPLQDRDYVLARRVKHFEKEGALVLRSRSSESSKFKLVDKVVRVDSYESRAAFISSPTNKTATYDKKNAIHQMGVKFVTIFCDEQKIAIAPSIMKMVSGQVEKLAKNTMERLHSVAVSVQKTVSSK